MYLKICGKMMIFHSLLYFRENDAMISQSLLSEFERNCLDIDAGIWDAGILKFIIKEDASGICQLPKDNGDFFLQGKTGYCWISSVLFCISQHLNNTKGMKYSTFSKTYLIFYDKLEKANKFLELVIAYRNCEINDSKISYLLNNAMTDQGQWNMAENLILKYGLIPYECMPDYTKEMGTGELNACLNYLLRYYAYNIHRINKKNRNRDMETGLFNHIEKIKNEALLQVYKLLIKCLGKPPKKIKLPIEFGCYYDLISPTNFFRYYIDFPFVNYCSISCIGTKIYTNYTIELDGNVIEGKKNTFLYLPDTIFDSLIWMQIKNEHFCWHTCDAGKFYIKNFSLFDEDLFKLNKFIDTKKSNEINRNTVFQYHIASPTHAMVMTDVRVEDDKLYYISHDSSGNSCNQYCCMAGNWFQKYVFQAIVNKLYLKEFLESQVIEEKSVKPWEFFYIN